MKFNKEVLGASAAYILGLKPMLEVKGTKKEIEAYKSVLESSKSLYESLNSTHSSLETVDCKLKEKKSAARHFKATTGNVWPF